MQIIPNLCSRYAWRSIQHHQIFLLVSLISKTAQLNSCLSKPMFTLIFLHVCFMFSSCQPHVYLVSCLLLFFSPCLILSLHLLLFPLDVCCFFLSYIFSSMFAPYFFMFTSCQPHVFLVFFQRIFSPFHIVFSNFA